MTKAQKIILSVATVVLIALLCVFICLSSKPASFTPPEFDANAVKGAIDNIDEAYNYRTIELPIKDQNCLVSFYSTPLQNAKELEIFFNNDNCNTVWTRIEIYDQNGKCVGESGLLTAGECIRSIMLEKGYNSGTVLTVKVLTYEPETYYSLGSVSAEIFVY